MYNLTKEDWKHIHQSSICQPYIEGKISTFSGSTILAIINGIMPTGEDSQSIIKFFFNLLEIISRVSSTGYPYVTDLNSYYNYHALQPLNMGTPVDTDISDLQKHRIKCVYATLNGGVLNDVELVAKLAGYKSRCILRCGWGDTTIGELRLTFQDDTDQVLNWPSYITYAISAKTIVNLNYSYNLLIYSDTEERSIEVDLSNGAGAEKLVFIIEYWYELTP
jgi:hypothetical protein